MKKVILVLITATIVCCTGCSKVQICVDKISGSWTLTKINDNGTDMSMPADEFIWTMRDCKIKKDDYCDFTAFYTSQNKTEYFKYKVDADCKTFSMHKATLTTDNDFQILELSNTKLTVKSGDVSFYQIMYFDKK